MLLVLVRAYKSPAGGDFGPCLSFVDTNHVRVIQSDINKILRNGDYADPDLALLNSEAIEMWGRPEWQGTFRSSGVAIFTQHGTPAATYSASSYQNVCLLLWP